MATVSTKNGGVWHAFIRVWVEDQGIWKRAWRTTGIPADQPKSKAVRVAEMLQEAAYAAAPASPSRTNRQTFTRILEEIWRLAGVEPPVKTVSWKDFWRETVEGGDAVEATKAGYRPKCLAFEQFLGSKAKAPLSDIDYRDCQRFYDRLLSDGKNPSTAKLFLAVIRIVMTRAVLLQLIPVNPTAMVRKAPLVQRDRQAFSRDEIRQMLAHVDGEGGEWTIATRLGIYCGMRLMDAVTRDWSDFDLRAGTVQFLPRKKARGGRYVTLPLVPALLEHLRPLAKESGLVTPGLAKMLNNTSSAQFIALLERAGVILKVRTEKGSRVKREKTFHSLRHTLLTELAVSGADKQLRMLISDHDDPRTNDRYTHSEVERMASALSRAFPE